MVSIPEPTSMAKNLVQTADTWKKWQAQATDAKAVADARLLAEANLLVIAMNDFTEGYRRRKWRVSRFSAELGRLSDGGRRR